MSLSAVVTAREAGAAVALAPVAQALLDDGGRCRVVAGKEAASAFERAGLPVWTSPERLGEAAVAALLADATPDVLLTGTSVHPDRDGWWWAGARAAAVPSVAVVDHWTPLVERFSHGRPFDCSPDAATVLDQASRIALLDAGAPFPVHVAGHPKLDEISQAVAVDAGQARRALDVAPDRPLVVFASEPMRDHFGSALRHGPHGHYDELSVLAALRDAVARWRPGALVVVKLHPLESDDAHAHADEPETRVLRASDNAALFAAADIVVGMTSLMLLESAAAGRPTISLRPGGGGAPFPAWAGSIVTVDDPAALGEALRDAAPSNRRQLTAAGAARTVLELARTLARMPRRETR